MPKTSLHINQWAKKFFFVSFLFLFSLLSAPSLNRDLRDFFLTGIMHQGCGLRGILKTECWYSCQRERVHTK